MADLTQDELRVLGAVDFGLTRTKEHLVPKFHPVWDSLTEKGMIRQIIFFEVTAEGAKALVAAELRNPPQRY